MSRASEAAQRVALAEVDEAKNAADAAVASAVATSAWHAHEASEERQRDGGDRSRPSFAERLAGAFGR